MGRIVPIVYTKVDGYTTKEAIKNYWFQNILDKSNEKEYEDFQMHQRLMRDENISKASKEFNATPKTETCIMGPSMNGEVVMSFEFY